MEIVCDVNKYHISIFRPSNLSWNVFGRFSLQIRQMGNGTTLLYSCRQEEEARTEGVELLLIKYTKNGLMDWI